MRKHGRRQLPLVIRLLIWALALGAAAWCALVAFVVVMEKSVPAAAPEDTRAIIVLGAQVKEDGSLSLQLKWRLDKAVEVYTAWPQPIVVCGAQGTDEPTTEARAMRDYLMQCGVPEADILMDETSFNTRQNLQNARSLLREEITRVLVVTSDYHLPRALALARDAGFEPSGAGSPIKLIYWPKNHFREALAWVKYAMQHWGILPY